MADEEVSSTYLEIMGQLEVVAEDEGLVAGRDTIALEEIESEGVALRHQPAKELRQDIEVNGESRHGGDNANGDDEDEA